jgi:hypothetical protein
MQDAAQGIEVEDEQKPQRCEPEQSSERVWALLFHIDSILGLEDWESGFKCHSF